MRKFTKINILSLLLITILLPISTWGTKSPLTFNHVDISYSISSPYYPVILHGKDLPSLISVPIGRISMYAFHRGKLEPIPFQIDRIDKKGRVQIPVSEKEKVREGTHDFDKNDECVFMAADIGKRIESLPQDIHAASATEIEITDPRTGEHKWVYVFVYPSSPPEVSERDYVSYNRLEDSIDSDTYRIAFSKEKPFLVNTLQWKKAGANRYSPDFFDIMKVRHTGKLFHRFDFIRTQDDYTSRIVAVKDGPVRVIRSTANKVRIVWQLSTPSISIDYIGYGNGFFTDTIIEIPFKMSWFFSDVETLMTLDGNDDPSLPQMKVFSRSMPEGFVIDGNMSEKEDSFNASGDKEFGVSNSFGKILVKMGLEKDFPIQYSVYVMDDKSILDPPEDIPGQFGNVGFLSTGWEKVDTSLHHMVFSVYMLRDVPIERGFEILEGSPSFVN